MRTLSDVVPWIGIAVAVANSWLPVPPAYGAEEPRSNSPETVRPAGDEPSSSEGEKDWNEYDGKLFTLRVGGGFLVDSATYAQDEASKQQIGLSPGVALRDLRILFSGRFKFAPRVRYSLGYMYDGANDVWRFRQTGFIVDIQELSGNLFIGRTKEGFSTNKFMVGYHGRTQERATANDAFLPILADGLRWTGTVFGGNVVYNLGWFTNALAQVKQTYVKNDSQFAARAVWLPYAGSESKSLLHLALEFRHGSSLDGSFQFRSKPESFQAPNYAVDTGKFPASSSNTYGFEAYYRPGSLMLGSEYFLSQISSPETGNPFFHGGEVFAAYLLTGEIRPYKERSGLFEAISPARSVFAGGRGAWEFVLRYSYIDLDSGPIAGGKFWRITPMLNWHLSDNVRLEASYGYGRLDRFDAVGGTQFFQTRLQLSL